MRGCPCCLSESWEPHPAAPLSVKVCQECGAIYGGPILRSQAHELVILQWADREAPPEETRYFDLQLVISDGSTRRVHGWMDTVTRKVVQIG